VKGKLNTEAMAIGGETTGFEIDSGESGHFELILSEQWQSKLRPHHEKTVGVFGPKVVLPGVERQKRPAIIVETLQKP
jgi:hypothetical protein